MRAADPGSQRSAARKSWWWRSVTSISKRNSRVGRPGGRTHPGASRLEKASRMRLNLSSEGSGASIFMVLREEKNTECALVS